MRDMYSGSTNLLDIFATSAITNQDVYWSANTDDSISNSSFTNVGINTDTPNANLTIAGSLSATGVSTLGETTVQDNLTVNDDLTVNTNTLYVDSTNEKIGINTLSPDGLLTISGGSGFVVYDLEGGTATFVKWFYKSEFWWWSVS